MEQEWINMQKKTFKSNLQEKHNNFSFRFKENIANFYKLK